MYTLTSLFTPGGSSFFSLLSALSKTFTSTTIPPSPFLTFSEVSFTSLSLLPKIALKSLTSGVASCSPLGVTLPTRISLALTSVPILTIPLSSRFLSASSERLGISLVISSSPSLVSLAETFFSSICMEVKASSLTSFSESKIASS